MNKPKHSIHYSIVLVVFLLGLSGFMLSVLTGYIYQDLILENQKKAFLSFSEREIGFIQMQIVSRAANLGLTTQSEPQFREAIKHRDHIRISALLDEQFRRFYVTTALLDLHSTYLFDLDFNILGYAGKNSVPTGSSGMACPNFMVAAKRRSGSERIKVISELCANYGAPVIAVLVPVGGLRLTGYLLVVVDPSEAFIDVENEMGVPMKLHKIGMDKGLSMDGWPEDNNDDHIVWKYVLESTLGIPVYEFEFSYDISYLRDQINATRLMLLSAATVVTLLFILFSFYNLRKTTLIPLKVLKGHLQRLTKDKEYLGESVHVDGNIEMYELAEGINSMSRELSDLYDELEQMAFTDSLTGLPNRALFKDRLEEAALDASQHGVPYALMVLDVNKFKAINDESGHYVGDLLLIEVARRLEQCLREADTIARIGGDEFGVVLNDVSDQTVVNIVAKKMIESLAVDMIIEGDCIEAGISIGAAVYSSGGEDSVTLLRQADAAMYAAKKSGVGYSF